MNSKMRFDENDLNKRGFLDVDLDPEMDLESEIQKLKKEKNAVILAHYYQDSDIQDLADFVGDSLQLSQEAARTKADMIAFAGVHFMAETAKILSPQKKVVVPDLKAGCSLSDSCPAPLFKKFMENYPDHVVVSYVNCTADLKTLTDICCTSSNAVHIINAIPPEKGIVFAPDKNLGAYLEKQTGRKLVKWDGACMVHEIFSREKITKLKLQHPEAIIIAHPECEEAVLQLAEYIGSTSGLLKFVQTNPAMSFIVATESGILHQMQLKCPDKTFIPAPPNNNCACNECPHMKRNTLKKLYLCMKYEQPEIILPDDVIFKAKASIDKMLEISAAVGLGG
ncbi:MAG: quinolinate synthase NadA [Saprospiraceae bacterium]|nr:quinolinate synthase NadA [Saprospiraceae bacterium]